MSQPSLSVIVAWANRPELERTLAHNDQQFGDVNAEIVIVNCGGDAALLGQCVGASTRPTRTIQLATPFNKALALNVGAHHARSETLFFLDADIELHPGLCAAALALVTDACAVTLDRVLESKEREEPEYPHLRSIAYIIELETSTGLRVPIETNRRRPADGSRSAPGLIFVRKQPFEEVDGMNSDLSGWGFEDIDLIARLQLGAGMRVLRTGSATHLSHGDDRRCLDGPSRARNEARNTSMCLANYGLGHYFGTYQDDVATWT